MSTEQIENTKIYLTDPDGIRLCTKDKLCTADIDVIPTLQSKTVTPTEQQQSITPDDGNVGLSEVIVEAAQNTGGGLKLNGIIKQYKVNAGANVNAGDFVEFVTKWSSGEFCISSVGSIRACKLGNNRVFLAYNNNTTKSIVGVVLTMEGNLVTVSNETEIFNGTINYFTAVALNDKVFLAYSIRLDDVYYLKTVVCAIDGTAITVGDAIEIFNGAAATVSAVALSDKVFLAYSYFASGNYYLKSVICTIDGTAIMAGTIQDVHTSTSTITKVKHLCVTALTDSKVFILYACTTGTKSYYVYGKVCIIDGSAITAGPYATIAATESGTYSHPCAVTLTDNKVFIVYRMGTKEIADSSTSCSYHLYRGPCIVEGTTITSFASSYLGSSVTVKGYTETLNDTSMVALTDSKVLIAHNRYYSDESYKYHLEVTVCDITDTKTAEGPATTLRTAVSGSNSRNAVVVFSDNSALVFSNVGESNYASVAVSGTTVTVQEAPETDGTFVQPATSSLHNVGVAKTSGAEGETVDVYCVQ